MNASSWQVSPDFEISTCVMEGNWLLFHSGTGATHQLNRVSGLVFSIFWGDKMPLNLNKLIALIPGACNLEINEIQQALEALLALHLIKRVV